MSSFIHDFKTFIMRGNVVDLAVGVILGASFGKIVSSFVTDLLMPPLGMVIGGIDFSHFKLPLKGGEAPVVISYGRFVNTVLDFLIIAFAVFILVRILGHFHRKKAEEEHKTCPECLSQVPINAKRCAHCCSLIESSV